MSSNYWGMSLNGYAVYWMQRPTLRAISVGELQVRLQENDLEGIFELILFTKSMIKSDEMVHPWNRKIELRIQCNII